MKPILLSVLLGLGIIFSPAMAQDPFLLERAQGGDPISQNKLGVMYRRGDGVPQNNKAALYWYTQAAEQGHAQAQKNLDRMGQPAC